MYMNESAVTVKKSFNLNQDVILDYVKIMLSLLTDNDLPKKKYSTPTPVLQNTNSSNNLTADEEGGETVISQHAEISHHAETADPDKCADKDNEDQDEDTLLLNQPES